MIPIVFTNGKRSRWRHEIVVPDVIDLSGKRMFEIKQSRYALVFFWLLLFLSHSSIAADVYHPKRMDPIEEPWRWGQITELQGRGVWNSYADEEDHLWFCGDEGVHYYDGYQWVDYLSKDTILGTPVEYLNADASGFLYAVSPAGIAKFVEGEWVQYFPRRDLPIIWNFRRIYFGGDGSLWASSWYWGFFRFYEGKITLFSKRNYAEILKRYIPELEVVTLPDDKDKVGNVEAFGTGVKCIQSFVCEVVPGSSADKAGIKVGDRLTRPDGTMLEGNNDYLDWILPVPSGEEITVRVTSPDGLVSEFRDIKMTNEQLIYRDDFERSDRYSSVLISDEGRVFMSSIDGVYCYGGYVNDHRDSTVDLWEFLKARPEAFTGSNTYSIVELLHLDRNYLWYTLHKAGLLRWNFEKEEFETVVEREIHDALWYDDETSMMTTESGKALYALRKGEVSAHSGMLESGERMTLTKRRNGEVIINAVGAVYTLDYSDRQWDSYDGLSYQCNGGDRRWFVGPEGVISEEHNDWRVYNALDGLPDQSLAVTMSPDGHVYGIGFSAPDDDGKEAFIMSKFLGERWEPIHLGQPNDYEFGGVVRISEDLTLIAVNYLKEDADIVNLAYLLRADGFESLEVPMLNVRNLWVDRRENLWAGGWGLHLKKPGEFWKAVKRMNMISISGIQETPDGMLFGTHGRGLFHFANGAFTGVSGSRHLYSDTVQSLIPFRDMYFTLGHSTVGCYDGDTWEEYRTLSQLHDFLPAGSFIDGIKRETDRILWINYSMQPSRDISHTVRFIPEDIPPDTWLDIASEEVSQPGNLALAWSGQDPWMKTAQENLHYSYKLDGEPWSTFSKETHKIFLELPIGNHRFMVKARDNDFNVDPTPALVEFEVLPSVWQQTWFLTLASITSLIILIQAWRIVRDKNNAEMLNSKLNESNADLAALNSELQVTLDSLQETQMVLVHNARTAGKSEIAAYVLHNVGNALNSACTTMSILSQENRNISFENLGRAYQMLRDHCGNLDHFITKTEKGKKLLPFLEANREHMQLKHDKRSALIRDVDEKLAKLLEIVDLQQENVTDIRMLEEVSLEEIIYNALEMLSGRLKESQIEVEFRKPKVALNKLELDRYLILNSIVTVIDYIMDYVLPDNEPADRIQLLLESTAKGGQVIVFNVPDAFLSRKRIDKVFSQDFYARNVTLQLRLHETVNTLIAIGGGIDCDCVSRESGVVFRMHLPGPK